MSEAQTPQRRCVFVGTPQALQHLTDWCRTIYHTTFGSEEGETRFKNLRLLDAIALYEAGGGEPLDPH